MRHAIQRNIRPYIINVGITPDNVSLVLKRPAVAISEVRKENKEVECTERDRTAQECSVRLRHIIYYDFAGGSKKCGEF